MNKDKSLLIKLSLLILLTSSAMAFTGSYTSIFLKGTCGANESQIGYFYSISSFFNVVVSMLLAYLSDKYSSIRKHILLIGLMSAVAGYAIYALTSNYLTVLISSCTLVAISSCVTPQLFALSSELFGKQNYTDSQISEKITFLRTMISVSYVIGPAIGAFVLDETHFERLFIIAAVFNLITFICVLIIFPKFQGINEEKEKKDTVQKGKSIKYLALLFIWFVLIQTVHSVISNIFPVYITSELNYSNKIVGFISSYSALVEIPIMLLLTYIVSKISLQKVMYVGLISGIIFIICFMNASQEWVIILSYTFNAIFYSITIGLGMAYFQSCVRNLPGIATTLFINTSSVGKIVAGNLVGILGNSYTIIFTVILVVLGVCLISLVKVKMESNG